MKLLRALPSNRTFEQVHNHYMVEKSIAERLKRASREERQYIYNTMYDELFRRVPDHPRLTQRSDEELTRKANAAKLALVRQFLHPACEFLEFAPGDCRFAMEVAPYVKTAHAVDISDQRAPGSVSPRNFNLIIYDGYRLDEIGSNSVDFVFSDQFIEHLHPEDAKLHFELVHRILKPGGKYVFLTPHAFTGPHDVSQFFSNKPQGFHLKEWIYSEVTPMLKDLNYSQFSAIWWARGIQLKLPYFYFKASEKVLDSLPWSVKRGLARYLVPSVCIMAVK